MLNQLKQLLERTSDLLVRISLVVSLLAMAMMVIVIIALVIGRYFLLYSLPWAEELTRFLMVWMSLLGAGIILRRDEHIRVDYFFNLMPKSVSVVLQIVFHIMTICYFGFLSKVGFSTASSMWIVRSPALGISMFWPYLVIPVTSVLMVIYIITNLVKNISGLVDFNRSNQSRKLKQIQMS